MSAAQVFELDRGLRFVAGLFWQPLPGVSPSQRKREMMRIAREQEFDLMVQPGTEVSQVGYAAEKDGAQAGPVSVAAAVARAVQEQALARNMLMACPVEGENWYYYAQRDGLILHNGDRVGTEADVRGWMAADLAESDWEAVIAPASWQIRGSSERPLTDFLPANSRIDYHRSRKLRPVKTRLRDLLVYWKFGAAILVVAAIGFGVMQWKSMQAARELAAYAQKQRELAALREAEAASIVHAWSTMPRAQVFAQACEDTQRKIATLWPGGWNLVNMSCTGNQLTVSWSRQSGWIDHMETVHPEVQFDATGDGAKLVLRLPQLRVEDERAPAEKESLIALQRAAQRHGLPIKTVASVAPKAPAGRDPAKVRFDWREVPWTLEGSMLSPASAATVLDGPGFRINSIESRYVNGVLTWSMKGVQYVRS